LGPIFGRYCDIDQPELDNHITICKLGLVRREKMINTSTKARRIHQKNVVAITHDHRPIGPDLPLMRIGGVDSKVFQIGQDVDLEAGLEESRTREDGWLALADAGLRDALRDIAGNASDCLLARTAGDIERAKAEGRVAILLGIEGARFLEGDLANLARFHAAGLRELQLTWAFPNPLVPDKRLSEFGAEVVRECERLGIIVDLTHIARRAFLDVCEVAAGPLIISHGAARAVTCDLDDESIRAIAASGGIFGVHFYTTYLGPAPEPEAVIRQIDHIAGLVGIDTVALGIDFFPTEGVWRDLQVAQGATNLEWAVRDMSELPLITECLLRHGYSDTDIGKILGGNFLRVCKKVFGS
jgi:membrane dipeptidase